MGSAARGRGEALAEARRSVAGRERCPPQPPASRDVAKPTAREGGRGCECRFGSMLRRGDGGEAPGPDRREARRGAGAAGAARRSVGKAGARHTM